MTEEQIIQGLECCGKNPPMCSKCGYKGKCNRIDCYDYLKRDVLDLIKRQKEKLESLTAENKKLKSDLIIAKQNYDHIRQQWQATRTKAKEAVSKYINKYSELFVKEEQLRTDAVKDFSKFLIDYAEGGVISVADLPELVIVWERKVESDEL